MGQDLPWACASLKSTTKRRSQRPCWQAADVSHADDLVQSASHWLFTRRILIPGARRLQDWARVAFAAVESQILGAVNAAVPPAAAQKVVAAAYSARPGTDTTHLGG